MLCDYCIQTHTVSELIIINYQRILSMRIQSTAQVNIICTCLARPVPGCGPVTPLALNLARMYSVYDGDEVDEDAPLPSTLFWPTPTPGISKRGSSGTSARVTGVKIKFTRIARQTFGNDLDFGFMCSDFVLTKAKKNKTKYDPSTRKAKRPGYRPLLGTAVD